MSKYEVSEAEALEYARMTASPLYWARQTYGLVPQRLKAEYKSRFSLGLLMRGKAWDAFCETVRPYWFESYREGIDITWQQTLAMYGVEKALRGEVPSRISIVSGHGIGKSALLAILILWFLWVHPMSQVACTSPSKEQMYDVLWKELSKWLQRMPEGMAANYIWEASHIRMREAPQVWFARAKTSSKENTEALAGVHADWVLMAVDEASGVEEPIFETMEGALTSGNVLVFLISNGTRSLGYFYDSHHKDAMRWQNFMFDSLESPRVDMTYVQGIIDKYGEDSVQYAIRVRGQFPDEGIMDDKGYVQLFNESDLHFVPFDADWNPVGRVKGALDASGEGQDSSDWAARDRMRAAIVAEEKTSTAASMAQVSLTVCTKYDIYPADFVIDAFGKGHQVSQEIALATVNDKNGAWRVTPINTGDACEDEVDRELYVNIRAMIYYKMMLWARAGGEFMMSERLKDELLSIRFKRTTNGRIQIMDKVMMKKLGFPSPNKADALSMTFLRPDNLQSAQSDAARHDRIERARHDFDPHATVE
jgi:phage terminase large subunit